jgi:hypothetical protein
MKFFYNVRDRKYCRFKTKSGFEDGEVTITKTIHKEIKINLFRKTKEENHEAVEKYYHKFRNIEENPLTQFINCFDKSFGRYFDDSADRWMEIDKEKTKKIC